MKKNNDGQYPLLLAVNNENIELVQLLRNYAIYNENNIILNINEKSKFYFDNYNPLYLAKRKNNVNIIQLLSNYIEKNNIINEMNKVGQFDEIYNYTPLLYAIKINYDYLVHLMLNYLKEK